MVLSGALRHVSEVGEAVLGPGDVQRLTAGTGVVHSETSADPREVTRFVQTWIRPAAPGLEPAYQLVRGALRERDDVLAAPDLGQGGAARLHLGRVPTGRTIDLPDGARRHVLVAAGDGTVSTAEGRHLVGAGDEVRLDGAQPVRLGTRSPLTVLVWVTG